MTPLVMVMGFADSMQMVSAIRIRLREGDTATRPCASPCAWWDRPACWRTASALLSFLALLFSQSGLIRTFGMAGSARRVHLVRRRHPGAAAARRHADPQRGDAGQGSHPDGQADGRARLVVGWIVDRVAHRPVPLHRCIGVVLFAVFTAAYLAAADRATDWPTRCPTASRRSMPRAASTRSSPAPIRCTS